MFNRSEKVPALPGSYALYLELPVETWIQVGRLGEIIFVPGIYVYLGSAMGPGGLRARLAHHERIANRPHWHIDWLRQKALLRGVCYSITVQSLECAWSQRLLQLPGAVLAAPGFGASDCNSGCAAHLVLLPQGFALGALAVILDSNPSSTPVEEFKIE